MPGSGELFLQQVREVQARDNSGVLITPSYFEPQMTRQEANQSSWSEFRERMKPIGIIQLDNSRIECLVTPKAVPWGMEDVNIFAGEEGREIYEIDDFETHEGESFLNLNFAIAERLLEDEQCDGVQVTIGFNRHDLSIGHHSVLKLHSHIRVAPSAIDISRRQSYPWGSLKRFDKLAFIEPFSTLHHDYIEQALQGGALSQFVTGVPRVGVGHSSIDLERSANLPKMFGQLSSLYSGMKLEYSRIAEIFTDESVDLVTGKFIPRPIEERISRLGYFLNSRGTSYSPKSIGALRYLAEHIQLAEPRDPQDPSAIASTATMYLSRGFAGAMTFAFEKNSDTVRLDFLPRVITTSTPTKTMMGEDLPTVIFRTDKPATEDDHRIALAYHQKVARILGSIVAPDQFISGD